MLISEDNIGKRNLAIISNGREIQYALPFLHLMKFEKENQILMPNLMQDYNVELYTPAVFKQTSISLHDIKIFLGSITQSTQPQDKVFDSYGIVIYHTGLTIHLLVTPENISHKNYCDFISYANTRRLEYIDIENLYFTKVHAIEPHWLPNVFCPIHFDGLFQAKKTMAARILQMYSCAAYILYLDFLPAILSKEEKKNDL